VALRGITPAETARPGPAGPVPFEHNSAAPKRNHHAAPAGSSRTYLVLLLCYLVFVVYGSLVPLKFHYVPLNVAWRQFLGIRYLSLGIASRADLVSNLLLLVPLTFFAMGTFARRDAPVSRWFVIAAIAAAAGALAVAIEFTQIYFPQRTVSLNDILAETAGAVVGIACWFLWGSLITDWARGLWQSRDEDRRAIRILCGYLVFLVLYQLLPFDATIRTVELYHRIKQGRVILLPFSDIHTFSLYAVMSKIAVMVPVGFLFCMVNRRHSVFRATVFGVMFAAGIEFLQIFIFSRVASSTDAVIGSLGTWMGAWLAVTVGPVSRKPLTQSPVWMRHRHWIKWAATVGWIAIIAWYKWRPFDFAWPVEGLFTHIASVARVPLYFQYYQSEFLASAQVVRLLTISFVAGMLLQGLMPADSRRLAAVVAIITIGLVLEAGRLFLPHRIPDVIQALLFIAGGVAGIRCFGPFTRLFLARPQAAQRDPIRPDHSDDPLPGDRPGL
jgi:VanZ family protein